MLGNGLHLRSDGLIEVAEWRKLKLRKEHFGMTHQERTDATANGLSRRAVTTGAGFALAASLMLTRPGAQVGAQAVRTGGGVGGGGQVKDNKTRTHFSVFATRFEGESIKEPVFVGKFQWVDSVAAVSIVSKTIEFYGEFEGGTKNEREIRGTAIMNDIDTEDYPFVVRLADEDTPGSGNDSITVYLGKVGQEDPMTNPLYTFGGKLDIGDIELVSFDIPF